MNKKIVLASLLVVFSLPVLARTFKAYNQPKPEKSPMPNPVWPLWFAAFVFTHTRRAGALMVAGLAVAAIFAIGPGWLR